MSGFSVAVVLDRVSGDEPGPCSITVAHGTEFPVAGIGRLGLVGVGGHWTSFGRETRGKCFYRIM
jgi:hypothetical protein